MNEHYCLSLASACGIPSAKSEYLHFGDVPAIVVKRFDRIVHEPFAVERRIRKTYARLWECSPRRSTRPMEGLRR